MGAESTKKQAIRQPIVSVLGHVDSGKTTLLDHIRGSLVAEKEAGNITQMIGATEVPLDKIHEICGDLLKTLDTDLTIPGLLFIDTPGHAAFTSLRKRGGSLSDIAVLVIDVNDGVQPQTREAIQILKDAKTPFIIALNKIDALPGWQTKHTSWTRNMKEQKQKLQQRLDEEIYKIMGDVNEYGITSERFDRVDSFQKKVGIVPISAKTGEGMPELLMVLSGLSQRFMQDDLEVHEGIGRGTVLEVNEVKGLGTTLDIILYDGTIQKDDTLVYSSEGEVKETPIKAILRSKPLKEMRREKQFERLDQVSPAAGIKLSAKGIDGVQPGAPVRAVRTPEQKDEAIKEIKAQVEDLSIETQPRGTIVKADSLGSLEAVANVFKKNDIPIGKASVGKITKKDLLEAETLEDDYQIVFGFNTEPVASARDQVKDSDVTVIASPIIYELVDEYKEWKQEREREKIQAQLAKVSRPGKFRVMPDHVFRSSNPAVVGVEIVEGAISSGSSFMTQDGERLGRIKAIQEDGESIDTAMKGDEVAVSLTDVQVGRQIEEGGTYLTDLTADDYRTLQELDDHLTANEKHALDEIVSVKDSKNPRWKLG